MNLTWLLYGFVQGVGTILITKDKGRKTILAGLVAAGLLGAMSQET